MTPEASDMQSRQKRKAEAERDEGESQRAGREKEGSQKVEVVYLLQMLIPK